MILFKTLMLDLIWPAISKVDDGGYQVFLYIGSYIPLALTLGPGMLAWALAANPRARQDCISSINDGCCTRETSGETDIENSQNEPEQPLLNEHDSTGYGSLNRK